MKRKPREAAIVIPIREDTLLAALQEAWREHGNAVKLGLTTQEMSAASGMHITQSRKHLAHLLATGQATAGMASRATIAGYHRQIPVYFIKK